MPWVLGALLTGALLAAAPAALVRFEAVEPHMGTLVRITVYTETEEAARAAFRAGFDRIRDLDRILSDYRPESELNAITRTAVGRPVPVSDDLFAVLRASQELADASGGAFDVTQGAVTRLWREARTSRQAPDPAALLEAAARSGHKKLTLDAARRTARLEVPRMALDVGGIAKGYAASEALAVLSRLGVRSALVAVSGDLAFSAAPPGENGWRIGIGDGDTAAGPPRQVLELRHAAVSTSGSSAQHLEVDGRRLSHIIDPSSGMGLTADVTVTVLAPHGLQADGLATALSVLGEAGLPLVESSPGASALIVTRGTSGSSAVASTRFPLPAAGTPPADRR